ncbi:MAG: hypothetical protein DMG49_21995 [Acidobacteria bacterium]|nr:MAG: hypothetical protein DMG49_21995 [Acidobacteriota bacterium]
MTVSRERFRHAGVAIRFSIKLVVCQRFGASFPIGHMASEGTISQPWAIQCDILESRLLGTGLEAILIIAPPHPDD